MGLLEGLYETPSRSRVFLNEKGRLAAKHGANWGKAAGSPYSATILSKFPLQMKDDKMGSWSWKKGDWLAPS